MLTPQQKVIRLGSSDNRARVLGVSRVADNSRAMLVSLDREPTDDELRRLHDLLRSPPSSSHSLN